MPWSKRSGLVPALLAASTLCGEAAASPASAASPLTVLGDSYSIPVHDGTRDWPAQLRDRGAVGQVRDFAKSGAIAATVGANTFARQIRLWTAAGRPRGDTVVYLGYNDIDGRQSLAPSQAGYRAAGRLHQRDHGRSRALEHDRALPRPRPLRAARGDDPGRDDRRPPALTGRSNRKPNRRGTVGPDRRPGREAKEGAGQRRRRPDLLRPGLGEQV